MNRRRIMALVTAVMMVFVLAGCERGTTGGEAHPGTSQETTVPETEQTQPTATVPAVPVKQLSAIQKYQDGQLSEETTLSYDQAGRIIKKEVNNYSKGQLKSVWVDTYLYDEAGNLIQREHISSLGTQRWEYENHYDTSGRLEGYGVSEYYVDGNLILQEEVSCYYDSQGRYQGEYPNALTAFDGLGRLLTSEAEERVTNETWGRVYREYEYTYPGFVIRNIRSVSPEFETTNRSLNRMLTPYHSVLSEVLQEDWELVVDYDGHLKRILTAEGEQLYLFIYD